MNLSINNITIISAYYGPVPNEPLYLRRRIEHFHRLRKIYPGIKMIIIDDGSPKFKLENRLFDVDLTNITLLKIKHDLGFNSHGARNLGMHITTSDWNLLVDVDISLESMRLDKLELLDDPNNVYTFAINTMLVHKQTFDSCKGYDEEFVNIHWGDEPLINYFKDNYNLIKIKTRLRFLRPGRHLVLSDEHYITEYRDLKRTYQPKNRWNRLEELKQIVEERYKTKNFSEKKTLKFLWEYIDQE